MGSLKKWQIAVVALAPIVLGVSLYLSFGRGKVQTSDTVLLVDLLTGERFVFSTSGRQTVIIPAENPDTGEQTLVPVRQDESGEWFADRRFMSMLTEHAKSQDELRRQMRSAGAPAPEPDELEKLYEKVRESSVLDLESSRIQVSDSSPKRVR